MRFKTEDGWMRQSVKKHGWVWISWLIYVTFGVSGNMDEQRLWGHLLFKCNEIIVTHQYITAIKARIGIVRERTRVNFNQDGSLNVPGMCSTWNLDSFHWQKCKDEKSVHLRVVNEIWHLIIRSSSTVAGVKVGNSASIKQWQVGIN